MIINWLWTGLVLVVAMVAIGGITRLTHSGLSMVEWKLIGGTIPPIGEAEWQETFEKYKQFPEYKLHNEGMSLSEFKQIFFWEYLHRLLGKLIGLVFIFPFLYFLSKKWISRDLGKKLVLLLLLGGLQGGLGWFMVKSGLVDRPAVSHIRLAIHLIAAFTLIGYIYWLILDLQRLRGTREKRISMLSKGMLALVVVQIVYGAFVAGLQAGYLCPTFPAMCGGFLSPTVGNMEFVSDPMNVQFIHRMLGWLVFGYAILLWFKVRKSVVTNQVGNLLLFAVMLQFALGVTTLVLHMPILVAVLHQVGAVFVFLLLLNLIRRAGAR
jgi:cytochrome c oxidase assembly protein subunit 15